MHDSELPASMVERLDEAPDASFYEQPRFVAHIDAETIAALTTFYDEYLPERADVLDLMSSWISHLPVNKPLGRVAGLGMNAAELQRNARLTDYVVHDLNVEPALPYDDASFERVLIAVSVQYLIRPMAVFREIRRALRPGGGVAVAMSHRCFPTKAIRAFRELPPAERIRLVSAYCSQARFGAVSVIDRSPPRADPLWIVTAQKT